MSEKKKTSFKKYAVLIILIVILYAIFSPNDDKTNSSKESKTSNIAEPILSGKYSEDIVLDERITEQQIEIRFNRIKREHQGFEQYYVHFYLPDMEIGNGAWATANYDGELKVSIQEHFAPQVVEKEIRKVEEKPVIYYWMNTKSNVRHNSSCRYYDNTKNGRFTTTRSGSACGICGG